MINKHYTLNSSYVSSVPKSLHHMTNQEVENTVVNLLHDIGITANPRKDAPGVYVDGAKICAIGLRVRKGCTYHGIALNVDMDLVPFSNINPCGFPDLKVTQIADHTRNVGISEVEDLLIRHMRQGFGYYVPAASMSCD